MSSKKLGDNLNLNSKYRYNSQPLGPGIYFYAPEDEYGYLSNYFVSPFIVNGKEYQSGEHYFQSKKHEGTHLEEEVRKCKTPDEAKKLANRTQLSSHAWKNWEERRYAVMKDTLRFKFMQNEILRNKFLQTHPYPLFEDTFPTDDTTWGIGKDCRGKNLLGKLLFDVRNEIMTFYDLQACMNEGNLQKSSKLSKSDSFSSLTKSSQGFESNENGQLEKNNSLQNEIRQLREETELLKKKNKQLEERLQKSVSSESLQTKMKEIKVDLEDLNALAENLRKNHSKEQGQRMIFIIQNFERRIDSLMSMNK